MRATDEQIARVKHASFHFGGLPTSAAIDAVLSELAALRERVDDVEDALTGTNSSRIDCSIIWDILYPPEKTKAIELAKGLGIKVPKAKEAT